jgi:hypothetical protein
LVLRPAPSPAATPRFRAAADVGGHRGQGRAQAQGAGGTPHSHSLHIHTRGFMIVYTCYFTSLRSTKITHHF